MNYLFSPEGSFITSTRTVGIIFTKTCYGSEEITEMQRECMRSFRRWKTSDNSSPHVVAKAASGDDFKIWRKAYLFLKYPSTTMHDDSLTSRQDR